MSKNETSKLVEDENDFTGVCCGELLDGYQLENHIKIHHKIIPADVEVITVHGVRVSGDGRLPLNNNDEKVKDENFEEVKNGGGKPKM